jgi:hypothetical protein
MKTLPQQPLDGGVKSGERLPPPPSATVLVTEPEQKFPLTDRQDCDARSALARGLAEYLGPQSFVAADGRRLQFADFFDAWADFEDPAHYPAAVVLPEGEGTYDASKFTPTTSPRDRVADDLYAVTVAELVQNLIVEVWATDVLEREGLMKLLEDTLNPVMWRYGCRLQLPHYCNVTGVYELVGVAFSDSTEDVHRRIRRVRVTVRGSIPVVRLHRLPTARPRFELASIGEDVTIAP